MLEEYDLKENNCFPKQFNKYVKVVYYEQ